MEQSVESNFFEKFKAIASLPILLPYFRLFFLKKRFLRKSSKPEHGNLVLITSSVQVELSKLNFNFDDIRTYFLQVLRDCWQITFATPNGFCLLSNKNPTPLFLTDNIKTDRILSKNFYIVFQVLKVLLIKICKIQSLDLLFLIMLFLLAITSVDIIFHKFLELNSKLSEKRFLSQFFFFTQIYSNPPTNPPSNPLSSQNPLSMAKVFCQCRLT